MPLARQRPGGVSVSNDGKIGQCYYFDGSGYLQFDSTITNIISSLNEITFSFWAKPTTTTGLQGIFLIRQGASSHQINFTNTGIVYRDAAHSSQTTIAYPAAVQDIWTHYLFSYAHGNWTVYINAALITDQGYTGTTHLNSNLNEVRIGRAQSSSGNTYYTGYINDFRIYNHALTAEEVRSIVANGLMVHYLLNGMPRDSGNIEYDISGYHNDAEIVGVGKQGFISSLSAPRYAQSYAGFSLIKYIKNADVAYEGGTWTISCWARSSAKPDAYESIFCLAKTDGEDANKKACICYAPTANTIWYELENKSGNIAGISYAEWHHFVMTCDGSTGKVYIDNELKATVTGITVRTGCHNLGIGCRSENDAFTTGVRPFTTGNLSDFRFYTKCLNADEVSTLYHMGV